jgi:3-hydroxyisobutyrate dehydrogenase-like beta-hydroxyacid dehydrogenase
MNDWEREAMKTGFIGLGTMGKPMAENLWKANFNLIVYNRNPEKTKSFRNRERLTVASSIEQVVELSDTICTIVTDDQAMKDIVLGEGGIAESCKKHPRSRTLIDCSTISPETTHVLAEELNRVDIEMLDAPVTGSLPQAEEGTLTFIVGGKEETFRKCSPFFQAMGQKAVYMGAQGTGTSAKLANNMLAAITLTGLAESMSMVAGSGGSPERFLEAVAGGGARSGMAEIKGPKILQQDFSPHFMMKLMHKDLKLAAGLAESVSLPAPVLNVAKEMFSAGCQSGWGDEDMCAIVRIYERWIGKA